MEMSRRIEEMAGKRIAADNGRHSSSSNDSNDSNDSSCSKSSRSSRITPSKPASDFTISHTTPLSKHDEDDDDDNKDTNNDDDSENNNNIDSKDNNGDDDEDGGVSAAKKSRGTCDVSIKVLTTGWCRHKHDYNDNGICHNDLYV